MTTASRDCFPPPAPCSSCRPSSCRPRRSRRCATARSLPGGPQEPVRVTYRGELIAIYGPCGGGPRPQAAREAVMEIITGLDGLADRPRALAIGTFDGVHAGHRATIERAVEMARQRGITSAVLSFNRHPLSVVDPQRVPQLLTPLAETDPPYRRARAGRAHPAALRYAALAAYERGGLLRRSACRGAAGASRRRRRELPLRRRRRRRRRSLRAGGAEHGLRDRRAATRDRARRVDQLDPRSSLCSAPARSRRCARSSGGHRR